MRVSKDINWHSKAVGVGMIEESMVVIQAKLSNKETGFYTQKMIAEELGVSDSLICRAIHEPWRSPGTFITMVKHLKKQKGADVTKLLRGYVLATGDISFAVNTDTLLAHDLAFAAAEASHNWEA